MTYETGKCPDCGNTVFQDQESIFGRWFLPCTECVEKKGDIIDQIIEDPENDFEENYRPILLPVKIERLQRFLDEAHSYKPVGSPSEHPMFFDKEWK